jgi:hypothetical protein
MPRKEGLDEWLEDKVAKQELGSHIRWIISSTDVKEPYYIGSDRFLDTMVCQGIVKLFQGRMWNGATGGHTLIFFKHVCTSIQRDSHHLKSVSKDHDCFGGDASSDELRTINCCFNSLLTLGETFN